MSAKTLTLEPTARFSPQNCPACAKPLTSIHFSDGDTVSPPAEYEPAPFNLHLQWAACPQCARTLYELNITVPSTMIDSYGFQDDKCYKSGARHLYRARLNGISWALSHLTDVTNATFYALTNKRPRLLPFRLAWLDEHVLDLFTAPDHPEALAVAAAKAQNVLPHILALTWDTGAPNPKKRPVGKRPH